MTLTLHPSLSTPPLHTMQEEKIVLAGNEVRSLLRILENQTYACCSVEALQTLCCAHRSNYVHETMNILTIVYTTAELNASVPEDKQGDVNLFHSTDMWDGLHPRNYMNNTARYTQWFPPILVVEQQTTNSSCLLLAVLCCHIFSVQLHLT